MLLVNETNGQFNVHGSLLVQPKDAEACVPNDKVASLEGTVTRPVSCPSDEQFSEIDDSHDLSASDPCEQRSLEQNSPVGLVGRLYTARWIPTERGPPCKTPSTGRSRSSDVRS